MLNIRFMYAQRKRTSNSVTAITLMCMLIGVSTALALGCRINPVSYFDRKHYFYADMPLGFQITQNRVPLAEHGQVYVGHGSTQAARYTHERLVTIEQLHLEHDSGKSMYFKSVFLVCEIGVVGESAVILLPFSILNANLSCVFLCCFFGLNPLRSFYRDKFAALFVFHGHAVVLDMIQ